MHPSKPGMLDSFCRQMRVFFASTAVTEDLLMHKGWKSSTIWHFRAIKLDSENAFQRWGAGFLDVEEASKKGLCLEPSDILQVSTSAVDVK